MAMAGSTEYLFHNYNIVTLCLFIDRRDTESHAIYLLRVCHKYILIDLRPEVDRFRSQYRRTVGPTQEGMTTSLYVYIFIHQT